MGVAGAGRPDSAGPAPPPEVQGMSSIYVALYLGGKNPTLPPGGTNTLLDLVHLNRPVSL